MKTDHSLNWSNRISGGAGETPLVPIVLILNGQRRCVHLKLEGYNPGGSVKDRTASSLITHFEFLGRLHPGSTLIESTSGNLGVALAGIAQSRSYEFIAVVDPKTTMENVDRMHSLGARIDLVEEPDASGGYLLSRLARVQERCASSPDLVWTDQYSNPANPLAHYLSTGPELFRQMHQHIDAILIPVSTGGTLAGISRYLREVSPSTRIIAVDARGSVIFSDCPAPRRLTGIGSSRKSNFIRPWTYDAFYLIGDAEAFTCCRAVFRETGLKVGGSSGAVLAACIQYLVSFPEAEHVVCLCADRGENYDSSIFADDWLRAHNLHSALSDWALDPLTEISLGNGN